MRRDGWTVLAVAIIAGYTENGLRPLLNRTPDGHGRRADGLTWWQADKLAVAIGCHPVEVWGADWFVAPTNRALEPLTMVA